MGYLILLAVPLLPLIVGAGYWWIKRTWRSFVIFLVSMLPMVAFARLVYLVLLTDKADPSTDEIALPFILGGLAILGICYGAFQRWPNETRKAVNLAASATLAISATRSYQKMRDREQAEALANEMDRRKDGNL